MSSWKPVIDKFQKRLSNWKARAMSFSGRLTLVNSVFSCLPLYYFSLFRALPGVLKKLECVRLNFFWGGSGDESKISWVKWDDVIRLWADGGHNFSSLNLKNLALIGYEIDNMGVEFTNSFSKIIGNGKNTKFWNEDWLINKPLKDVFKRLVRLDSNQDATVSDRLSWNGQHCVARWCWLWNISKRTKGEQEELEELIGS
ncbi:uncharacterized protein [Rutidosis leptorrhynchoides]|uniref:uncharacterized protein n=1 Tax=Rutidosis leptorrhynchoides TaxID=125765 RepID=UPI003A9A29DC